MAIFNSYVKLPEGIYIYICIQLFGYHTPTGYEIVRTNLANEMGPHPVCMYIYIYMCNPSWAEICSWDIRIIFMGFHRI